MAGKKPSGAAVRSKPAFAVWSRTFLAELANTSNVTSSAAKAGVDKSDVYRVRRSNAKFARQWQVALCEGYDNLEMALLYRLRIGELKPASGSKRAVRTFDNATAFRLLAAHRESAAAERATRDNEDTEVILASINASLERMRQRSLQNERERDAKGE
jgi:hypothetical protein